MAGLILASGSPRRKQLLEWAEVDFFVAASDSDESYPASLSPEEVAMHVAEGKAAAVAARYPGKTVLAADTIVVVDAYILGKPADRLDALRMLALLAGRGHRVITGVCLRKNERIVRFSETTEVFFHPLSAEEIAHYVDAYQPFDKAGAYGIQELIGVTGIRRIEGDFYNVMGLPVSRVLRALREFAP